MDLSVIQGPFPVAPCQTLVSRFATFSSPYVLLGREDGVPRHHERLGRLPTHAPVGVEGEVELMRRGAFAWCDRPSI